MRRFPLLMALMVISARLVAQQGLPAGTVIPVTLTSSFDSSKARPGQRITARAMQALSATPNFEVPSGAKVLGHVLEGQPHGGGGSQLSLRFDHIMVKDREISATIGLRAIASFMEVNGARIPQTGPNEGTSVYGWTTVQVGGDVVYGAGGPVMAGATEVGRDVAGGVAVRLTATPGSECAEGSHNTNQLESLWVFSSGACGVYGFPDLVIRQSGRTAPVGEIVLSSSRKILKLPSGTGMLLQIIGDSH